MRPVRPLPEEHSGDDEARDDEEHVDADVAAAQAGEAGVVEHDQGDSDGPEAFHVGPEPTIPGGGPRFVGQTGRDLLRVGRRRNGDRPSTGRIRVRAHRQGCPTVPIHRAPPVQPTQASCDAWGPGTVGRRPAVLEPPDRDS